MQKEIEKLDHFGRGITNVNGKVCFVFDALVGEMVKIHITKSKRVLSLFSCLGRM